MKINVFRQSSIKLSENIIIYFDPYKINEAFHDADYIFITHDHYDHYDLESIKNVSKETTKLIVPKCLNNISFAKLVVSPNEEYNLGDISFKTVASYNQNKPFHPKEKDYVGYLLTLNNKTYYIMGDTDVTSEALAIKCDVLFVPIGGTYTMNIKEAVDYVNKVQPKEVIPIHYGSIVGDISLGEKFRQLINKEIDVKLYIKEEEK